ARIEAALALAPVLSGRAGQASAVAMLDAVAPGLEGEHALRLDVERTYLSMFVPELVSAAREHMREYALLGGDTPAERVALVNVALMTCLDAAGEAGLASELALRALR